MHWIYRQIWNNRDLMHWIRRATPSRTSRQWVKCSIDWCWTSSPRSLIYLRRLIRFSRRIDVALDWDGPASCYEWRVRRFKHRSINPARRSRSISCVWLHRSPSIDQLVEVHVQRNRSPLDWLKSYFDSPLSFVRWKYFHPIPPPSTQKQYRAHHWVLSCFQCILNVYIRAHHWVLSCFQCILNVYIGPLSSLIRSSHVL